MGTTTLATTTKTPARRGRPAKATAPSVAVPPVIDLDGPLVATTVSDAATTPATALSGVLGDSVTAGSSNDILPAGQAEHLRRGAEGSGNLQPTSPPPCRHETTHSRIRGHEVDRVCEACGDVTDTRNLTRYVGGAGRE